MTTATGERELSYEEERGKPMPSKVHGMVQMSLGIELSAHREYRVLSELSLELNGERFTPDLCIYPREPMNVWDDEPRVTIPPLLAVEIYSASQGYNDFIPKFRAYFRAGVKSCWLVNPAQHAITIYTPDGGEKTFLPGQVAVDPIIGVTAEVDAVFA